MFKNNGLLRIAGLATTTLAIALGASSAAEASYYLNRAEAVHFARVYVDDEFRNTKWLDLSAHCRPQGLSRPEPGYIYHSWVCRWYDDGDNTTGRVLIKGSRKRHTYYAREL